MDFGESPPAPAGFARDVHELRVDGPRTLLQAVPYLLGFHPHESLVLVGSGAGTVRVTARLDLADVVRPGPVEHAIDVLARAGADSVFAAVYADGGDGGQPAPPTEELVGDLDAAARALGCVLVDVYLVRRGHWWSRRLDGPGWGTGSGDLVANPATAFAAAATVAGLTALPSRQELVAVLEPCEVHQRERLRPMIVLALDAAAAAGDSQRSRAHQPVRALTRAVFAAARLADADSPPTEDGALARLGAALSITAVRDSAWLAVDGGRLDGRMLWAELARRLPAPYHAPALFLYGWNCWRRGDGASAQAAIDRALAGAPGYPAAELLQVALAHGVDPRRVPRLRRGLRVSGRAGTEPAARRRGR